MKWSFDEEILLIELYDYTTKHSVDENEIAISELSQKLRTYAQRKGIIIDDKYRNIAGIKMKLLNIVYIATKGDEGLSSYSSLDEECYYLYTNEHERYVDLVSIANAQIIGVNNPVSLGINEDVEQKEDSNQDTKVDAIIPSITKLSTKEYNKKFWDTPIYMAFDVNPDDYVFINLDELDFSVRTTKRLRLFRVKNAAELLKMTKCQLMKINGFGESCFQEIIETILFTKEPVKSHNEDYKRIIINRYVEEIRKGDFESIRVSNDGEKEVVEQYKDAFCVLGEELVGSCINNTTSVLPICEALVNYSSNYLRIEELKSIINVAVDGRFDKKPIPFIEAYTQNDVKREVLYKCFKDTEKLSDIVSCVYSLDKSDFYHIRDFLKWCNFNVEQEVRVWFEKLFQKNDRASFVLNCRAKKMTLDQVGNQCSPHITRERVRQIETKIKRQFVHEQSKSKTLLKISALKGGDEIITPLDVANYCGEYCDIFLFLIKTCDINSFSYDKQIDAFVIGKSTLSERIQEFIDSLPDSIMNEELNNRIEEFISEDGISYELVKNAIGESFRITGNIYHRTRLTLANIYDDILRKYYPDGLKIYDPSILKEFRQHVFDLYGDVKLPQTDRPLSARIANVSILCGRGIYKAKQKKYISKELADKLFDYINRSEYSVILINSIFITYKDELLSEGVDNRYYLQGILRELFEESFSFRRDYIYKDSANISLYGEICKMISKSRYPVSKKEIYNAFPGITEIIINCASSDPDILNYFGSYFHADNLVILPDELDYLQSVLKETIRDNQPHHDSELYNIINSVRPEILTRNGALTPFSTFSVLEHLFGDVAQFDRPYIASNCVDIEGPIDRIRKTLNGKDLINISDVIAYTKEIHFQVNSIIELLSMFNDEYLIVDSSKIQSIKSLGISEGTIRELERIVLKEIDDCVPITSLTCVNVFPRINAPWSEWLVYSALRKWSTDLEVGLSNNQFKYAVPLVSPNGKMTEESKAKYENYEKSQLQKIDNLDDIDSLIIDYLSEDIGW